MLKRSEMRCILAAVLVLILLLAGCNVLEPVRIGNSGQDYRSLLLLGNNSLNSGNYAQARDYYARAMDRNPTGSEAYLFHAQAVAALYHVEYSQLKGQFDGKSNTSSLGVPFVDSNSTVESLDSIYYPVSVAAQDLEHIIRLKDQVIYLDEEGNFPLPPDGDTASDGRISPSVARLDLGLLEAVRGMLVALDLDGNNHIDAHCGASLSPASKQLICSKGDSSEVIRLASYKALTADIQLNDLNVTGLNVRSLSTSPHDINGFINSTLNPIAGAAYNLDSVSSSLKSHGEDSLGNDLSEIVSRVRNLSDFLSYLRYNDGIDNDYDHQRVEDLNPPQVPTRMLWHDFDKDRGVRYDFDDSARFAGFKASSQGGGATFGNPGNIGHPVHRYLHPELYVRFSELLKTYPKLAKDTSKDGRLPQMRKRCRAIVDGLGIAGSMTTALKSLVKTSVCDSISSVLRADAPRPARSEWVGGTPGVDEEVLDNYDNDYDGLTDEDSRNTPGLDDDGDGAINTSMIGKAVPPMLWHDAVGHINMCSNNVVCSCPDIDTTVPMPPVPFQRQFCIGSLENRLYWARYGGKDSLYAHYGRSPGDAFNRTCKDQYYELDPNFLRQWNATDAEWQLACQFSHIWNSERPQNSEWTGGTLGVDEEKLDGADNDGDGWIDEDVCDPAALGCSQ